MTQRGTPSEGAPADWTGHDLFADPSAAWAVKRAVAVDVEFARADGVLDTLEGPVAYRAGDALLTDGRGNRWPMSKARFLRDYQPVESNTAGAGCYTKRPRRVRALRMRAAFVVDAGYARDRLRGQAGDWLLQYCRGEYGIVAARPFAETYVILDSGPTR